LRFLEKTLHKINILSKELLEKEKTPEFRKSGRRRRKKRTHRAGPVILEKQRTEVGEPPGKIVERRLGGKNAGTRKRLHSKPKMKGHKNEKKRGRQKGPMKKTVFRANRI